MKNKIIRLLIIFVLFTNCFPANAQEVYGLSVPVRFRYEVSSSDLEQGDGIPIEITENVYQGDKILFKEYSSGIAYVSSFKGSASFGRGGNIEIRNGYLTDVNGKKHNILLSSNAKGRGSLTPIILTLGSAALSYGVWDLVLDGSIGVPSILAASALTLLPVRTAQMRGSEAKLSPAKIVFAYVSN